MPEDRGVSAVLGPLALEIAHHSHLGTGAREDRGQVDPEPRPRPGCGGSRGRLPRRVHLGDRQGALSAIEADDQPSRRLVAQDDRQDGEWHHVAWRAQHPAGRAKGAVQPQRRDQQEVVPQPRREVAGPDPAG